MEAQEFKQLIRPVRARLGQALLLRASLSGLLCGLGAACAWVLFCRFVPVPFYRWIAAMIAAAGCAGGIVYAFVRRPTDADAAREMDRRGLHESVSTALAYAGQDSPVIRLQREQAAALARQFVRGMHRAIPVKAGKRQTVGTAALALLLVALAAWPNPLDAVMEQRRAERSWIAEQADKTAELAEEWKRQPQAESAKEIEQALDTLQQGLKNSDTALAALTEMERALERTQQLTERLEKERVKAEQWARELQETPALRPLGQALAQLAPDALPQALASLRQQAAAMTPLEREQFARQLERLAADAAAPDAATAQALRDALQKLADAQLAQAGPGGAQPGTAGAAPGSAAGGASGAGAAPDEAALQQLQAALDSAIARQLGQAALQQSAQRLGAQLAQMGSPMAQQLAAAGVTPPAAWAEGGLAQALAAAQPGAPQAGAGAGTAPGSAASAGAVGASPGGADAAGAGRGASGSAGQGSGASGGVAGSSANGGPGAGGSAGQGGGAGQAASGGADGGTGGTRGGTGSGSRTLVSTPRSLEGSGSVYADGGPSGGPGGELQQGGPAPGAPGVTRPYEEVYSQYAAEATSSLDRSPLPQNMQNLVRGYFLEIQPER